MNIRKIALKLLLEHEENGTFVNLSLQNHVVDGLGAEQRSALTALLYTTVERKLTLDYLIGALAKRSVESLEMRTRCILRLGICQILYMKNIPDYAAVNETVALCRGGERSIVNFVLRECTRRKDSLPMPPREKSAVRYLSVMYSVPQWIVKVLIGQLGEAEAEAYLDAICREAPLTVAVNTTKISRDEYLDTLKSMGMRAEKSAKSPVGVRILDHIRPSSLYGYDEGYFFVQDEASQLAVAALCAHSGDRIVDVCACPGGKSFGAAIAMGDVGEVLALDLYESKLSLVTDGALRLGLGSVRAEVCDARTPLLSLHGSVDGVICDVPCSGLGVLSKKPDLRYRSEDSLDELATLGYEILNASAGYVKTGGVLVFSTCTVRREENEDVVERFLAQHPSFSPEPFSIGDTLYPEGIVRTYPHIDGCDGFFIARLRKN